MSPVIGTNPNVVKLWQAIEVWNNMSKLKLHTTGREVPSDDPAGQETLSLSDYLTLPPNQGGLGWSISVS